MSPIAGITLSSVPAAAMLLFTFAGLNTTVSPTIAGALQHFAAGVLLCTVGTELLPAMVGAEGWKENFAAFIGFFSGVAVLIALGVIMPDTELDIVREDDVEQVPVDGQEDEQQEDATISAAAAAAASEAVPTTAPRSSSLSPSMAAPCKRDSIFGRRTSIKTAAFHAQEVSSSISKVADAATEATRLLSIYESETGHASTTSTSTSRCSTSKPFPTALILAVAIDSLMDGLLIGIAVAAGPSAGPMMSASLSVEMSFLGLTLATALHGHSAKKAIPAAFLGPLAIVGGAAIGGFMAYQLGHDPVLLVGMLSFGTSALLFMVAEELLLEAHEGGGEHLWWVDLQLYTGFFASVVAGKFAPTS
mmetsp:Transcript_28507/g.63417  ORF Transcript_28507/g.63417 Transcript_28507/m.63417 type:complete len:362 (+) Transcript_28507:38-1123(+)